MVGTNVRSRRERALAIVAAIVFVLGAVIAWSFGGGFAAMVDGRPFDLARPSIDVSGIGALLRNESGAAPFLSVRGGGPLPAWWIASIVLLLIWSGLLVRPLVRRMRRDERTEALMRPDAVAKGYSAAAIKKLGRYTRADLGRGRHAPTEYGYHLGHLRDGKKKDVWVDWEKRIRVIARPGWGKTSRLLVPWARSVPGAALIGSVKADLFQQTVAARENRGAVRVVDFSDPMHRFAAGYDEVRWDPIPGCQDMTVATRRARALVAGADDGDRSDSQDSFWRDSARQVIEAWFHAAALGGFDIDKVISWQMNIHSDEPKAILRKHASAERRALLSLEKHLDERAARTTSSVERFIVLALGPFGSRIGRAFVGTGRDSLDIRQSIANHETIYLLASEDTTGAAAPILTLFADEWFYQARSLAQSTPGNRLTPPAVAVLDELRWLVPLPSLPAIAARDRAAGIGLVYAVQAMQQEQALYGDEAKALEQSVQVSIVGGFDESAWQSLSHRAGHAAVTSVSVSGGFMSTPNVTDSQQWREVITAADQQQLRDGESIVSIAGEPLMYVYSPSFRQRRATRKQIAQEEAEVRQRTQLAQEGAAAMREQEAQSAARAYSRSHDEPASWAPPAPPAPPAAAAAAALSLYEQPTTPPLPAAAPAWAPSSAPAPAATPPAWVPPQSKE